MIPDITHGIDEDKIFPHFRFYFNDSDLALLSRNPKGKVESVMHQVDFEKEINDFFEEWKAEKLQEEKDGRMEK